MGMGKTGIPWVPWDSHGNGNTLQIKQVYYGVYQRFISLSAGENRLEVFQ